MNQETRNCQFCRQNFTIEPDDFSFYNQIKMPAPTFCPQCRKQRRLSWRNDMNLYSRKCDLCGKSVVSLYSADKPMPVYCNKCWWSDKWDPKSCGVEYDFSKTFFEQYKALQNRVPVLAMVNDDGVASVNCEYTHDFAFGKNCYMVFIAWRLESCLYSWYILGSKEVVDSIMSLEGCEYTYETIFVEKCYRCRYVYYSGNLVNCAFCFDCRGCTDCLMCVGLRNKQYCVLNRQYTKEEYEKILADYRLDTHSGVERAKKDFQKIFYSMPRKFANLRNTVGSTGDYLFNCKNLKDCFGVQRGESCRYDENSDGPKNCYDLSVGGELEQCYEGITPDHSYHGFFAVFSWKNNEVAYVDGCHSSKYLFGCCGLKSAQYCILNRQYTKEEYEELVPKIIQQMSDTPYIDGKGRTYKYGEFFPSELSYFGYNETVAQTEIPITKDEADRIGFVWQNELQMTTGKETVRPEALPDGIDDVSDDILKEVLRCVDCGRNYKIVAQELRFYRGMKVPIPRKCFYCRHSDRWNLKNPFKLWPRKCQCAGKASEGGAYENTGKHSHGEGKCPNEFETSYSPDRKEIVYCGDCYNSEIV